jgi:phenylpropionate dioxygenase-like ring-hydroxylating dioxygenase large terminal subunit
MLTTKPPLMRRFWYATVPLSALVAGPQPFRLMGEDIVLFLDGEGEPAALRDRCVHRTAKLSKGWCIDGELVCGYHGWTYAADGRVTRIPQLDGQGSTPKHQGTSYRCVARYGYAWVALGDPIRPIFDIPEDGAAGYRRIFQFYDRWNTAPLRFMENSFDNAHFSFVHRSTFGDVAQPIPANYSIEETDDGFYGQSTVGILNPPAAYAVTGSTEPTTTRAMRNFWYLPFCRRIDMAYPSGVRHIIINCATPIDDGSIQLVQLLYRNDTEADCSTQALIDWDAQIVAEDRDILESTDPDASIDVARRIEAHMPSDRPGIIMRQRLLKLLKEYGEDEVTNTVGESASRAGALPTKRVATAGLAP